VSIIDEWRRVRAITTRNDFVALHPHVFLVSAPERGTAEFTPLTKPTEFRTVTHKADAPLPLRGPLLQLPETPLILPLRKSEGHPFPERISIGRATNCDVVIRDPSVSKLHGHFRDVGPESACFTDARSANGSRVDGVLIKPGEAIELRQHALLSVGRVQLMLISAADAYDWL